jgi:hypothetical protein
MPCLLLSGVGFSLLFTAGGNHLLGNINRWTGCGITKANAPARFRDTSKMRCESNKVGPSTTMRRSDNA